MKSLWLSLVLLSCSPAPTGTSPPPPEPPAPTAAPTPSETAGTIPTSAPSVPSAAPSADPSARWEGRWTSPACGKRKYERWIDLFPGGKLTGQDMVSPCPKNAVCVWSGIVNWDGTWKLEGDKVKLTAKSGPGPGGTIVLPTELIWDEAAKAPAEMQGEQRCPYKPRPPPTSK